MTRPTVSVPRLSVPKGTKEFLGGKTAGNYYVFPDIRFVRRALSLPRGPIPEDCNLSLPTVTTPSLRKEQAYAISRLLDLDGAVVMLRPGKGKSRIAVTVADLTEASKILIVAPASLLFLWGREIKKWSPHSSVSIREPNDSRFVVTSYDTLRLYPDKYAQKYDILIVDESILIKNRKTGRFQALQHVRRQSRPQKVILLSASPISKYYDDLWTQFNLISPEVFTSYWRFVDWVCYRQSTPWSDWEICGNKPLNLLDDFGDFLIPDIGPSEIEFDIEYIPVELAPKQKSAYLQALNTFKVELQSRTISIKEKISQILRLQQISSGLSNLDPFEEESSKADFILEFAETHPESFPLLVWVHFRDGAETLYNRLQKAGYRTQLLLGGSSNEFIERLGEGIKLKSIDIALVGLNVGKYGLTLPVNSQIFLDRTFQSDSFYQAIHRPRKSVRTIVLQSGIDSLIDENLSSKLETLINLGNDELLSLLRRCVK